MENLYATLPQAQHNFNSSMVRLMGIQFYPLGDDQINFNSSMVRLMEP